MSKGSDAMDEKCKYLHSDGKGTILLCGVRDPELAFSCPCEDYEKEPPVMGDHLKRTSGMTNETKALVLLLVFYLAAVIAVALTITRG